jgi:hypothetical protein
MYQIYFGPLKNRFPNIDWVAPQGFTRIRICTVTGKIANSSCPFRWETYIYGSEPEACPITHTPPKKEDKDPAQKDPKKPGNDNKNSPNPDPSKDKDPTKEEKPPTNPPSNDPADPSLPDSSFYKAPASDTDTFRLEFSSSRIKKGSPIEMDMQIVDQRGDSFEIFINGNLAAYLNEYPYRYFFLPEESGENLLQVVLKDKDGNILGTKILYFYVFAS